MLRAETSVYTSLEALEAAATPTSKATIISTEAMVVAELVRSAETTAMKPMPERMIMTAMAIT